LNSLLRQGVLQWIMMPFFVILRSYSDAGGVKGE
jgi:hypothetical protein